MKLAEREQYLSLYCNLDFRQYTESRRRWNCDFVVQLKGLRSNGVSAFDHFTLTGNTIHWNARPNTPHRISAHLILNFCQYLKLCNVKWQVYGRIMNLKRCERNPCFCFEVSTRSQWQRGLRNGSAPLSLAGIIGSNPVFRAWTLSSTFLYVRLITRPGEPYRVRCV